MIPYTKIYSSQTKHNTQSSSDLFGLLEDLEEGPPPAVPALLRRPPLVVGEVGVVDEAHLARDGPLGVLGTTYVEDILFCCCLLSTG